MVPELAVVSFKRVNSGSIRSSDILKILRQDTPRLLLLTAGEKHDDDWKAFLAQYEAVGFDSEHVLLRLNARFSSNTNSAITLMHEK